MTINIDIWQAANGTGRIYSIDAQATISYSPREGFDADKLAALERDLGPYITRRLADAMKEGAA